MCSQHFDVMGVNVVNDKQVNNAKMLLHLGMKYLCRYVHTYKYIYKWCVYLCGRPYRHEKMAKLLVIHGVLVFFLLLPFCTFLKYFILKASNKKKYFK